MRGHVEAAPSIRPLTDSTAAQRWPSNARVAPDPPRAVYLQLEESMPYLNMLALLTRMHAG